MLTVSIALHSVCSNTTAALVSDLRMLVALLIQLFLVITAYNVQRSHVSLGSIWVYHYYYT